MRKGWKEVTIGDIGQVITGNTPPRKQPELYGNHTIFVKPTDMEVGKKYCYNPEEFYSEKGFIKYKKSLIPKDSTCVVTIGSIGQKMIKAHTDLFINQAVNAIVPNKNYNSDFVYYLLKINLFQLKTFDSGTASGRENVSKSSFSNIKLIIPESKEIQRKIASILSSYDDLIENNLKRIKLLEEKAQLTYEEWFVKMHFPDYETTKFDEITGLPEGWEIVKVKDYVSEISKGPSLKYDLEGRKYPVLNQSCVRNGEIELDKILYAQELNSSKENCYLRINDILINSMGQGTLGRVSKNVSIKDKYIIHNCITFVRAKKEFSQFQLYYFIASHQKYFESIAQGSTGQTTLKISLIEDLDILLPIRSVIEKFNTCIDPIWKNIGLLKKQNSLLKEARDILLPRLMSGMIDVEELEIESLQITE